MFIGHLACAFAAKKAAPRTSIATFLVAAQLPDVLWPVFLLLGWEHVTIAPGDTAFAPLRFDSYPFSHSLLAVLLWAGAGAALYKRWRGDGRVALLVGALVVSHWVLDFVTHRADLPLVPGGRRFGLGLWNSVAGTMVVEGMLWIAGLWLYLRATRASDRIGRYAFGALVALLSALYVANASGPPPPSVPAIAVAGLAAAALFTAWAYWADRHRRFVP
jgi:hypothetical protein